MSALFSFSSPKSDQFSIEAYSRSYPLHNLAHHPNQQSKINMCEVSLRSELRRVSHKPSSFERLPGEIRNHIFELCIQSALRPSSKLCATELSILPRWHGTVRARMTGIGPMGFLFVKKCIYEELLSMIYSQIGTLRIGGYILQHPGDQLLRWELLYSVLMNPYTVRYLKSVKVKLPSIRDDIQRRNDSLRGFSITGFIGARSPPRCEAILAVVPGLVKCLEKFESLVDLEITVTVEMASPPDFDPLLPLYDLCGKHTTVVFIDYSENIRNNFISDRSYWAESWDIAWKDCLIRNGRRRTENLE